jgi:hypothetical protein
LIWLLTTVHFTGSVIYTSELHLRISGKGKLILLNYGMDTTGEKEKRTSRKTWMEGVKAAMTTRNLEPDQWRN